MAKNQKRKKKQKRSNGWQAKPTNLGAVTENQYGDRYFAQVNSNSFDPCGSRLFYEKAYGEQLFQADTLYIFVGTDSGLLPKYIQSREIPDNSKYLFIEPDGVFEALEALISLPSLDPAILVKPAENLLEALADPGFTQYIYADNNLFFESVAVKEGTYPGYKDLSTQVQQEWMDRIWRTKVAANQKDFIERQLENLAENRISSICLKDAFKGQTAILLGGGPSLDDALPWIKGNRSKLVVLAISRVCRRLREVDLVPDIVFSVDPNPINYENSIDLFHFWEKTLFINAHHVSPQLLAQWRGKSVYSGPRFPWSTPHNEDTLPLANPTVTNTGLASAVSMGFTQVILAGVDLCHSREGYTHAQGSHEYKAGVQVVGSFQQVKTNAGWLAETTPAYANAIREIGLQAEQAWVQGCTVINSASCAAVIPNVNHRLICEIVLVEPPGSVKDIISRALPEDEPRDRLAHYRKMLEELERGNGSLKQIRSLAIEARQCINRLLGAGTESERNKSKERLRDIENLRNEQYSSFDGLVRSFGFEKFQPIVGACSSTRRSMLEIELTGRQFYEVYIEVAENLFELLNSAQQRVHTRIEEEQPIPDFDLLKTQWQLDEQFGRVFVWQNRQNDFAQGLGRGNLLELEAVFLQKLEKIQDRYVHGPRRACGGKDREYLLPLFNEGDSAKLGCYLTEIELIEEREENYQYSYLNMAMRPPGYLPDNPFQCQIVDSPVYSIGPGDILFAYIYLEPDGYRGGPPNGICLQWLAGGRRYRAVWGELPSFLSDNADVIVEIASLPPAGEWVRLAVPADRLGLAGLTVDGFSVLFDGGFAYWDGAGVISSSGTFRCWEEQAHKASAHNRMGQGLDWLGKAPYDSTSAITAFILDKVPVVCEDHFFVDVLLDPRNLPEQIFLEYRWLNDKKQRFYWGKALPNDLQSRMGTLPEAGHWTRLTIPLSEIGSGRRKVNLIWLGVFNGLCSWREIGIQSPQTQNLLWSSSSHKGDNAFSFYSLGMGLNLSLPWPEILLKPLVKGYLYELAGRKEDALVEYHKLVGERIHVEYMEDALKRIAALSLENQDIENTLLAYQCLAGISISYVSQYAEMLRLMGRFEEAVEEYSRYLSRVPDDLNSMLNLGRIYLNHMNSSVAARMAFEYVLEKNPGNPQALVLLKELEA